LARGRRRVRRFCARYSERKTVESVLRRMRKLHVKKRVEFVTGWVSGGGSGMHR
jgi:hypothetical protein